MFIQPIHDHFILPHRATDGSGAYDLFMHEPGEIPAYGKAQIPLGFAAAVPTGHVALLLPRSGVGVREGLELENTCGVIDSDYRGEWMATLRLKPRTHEPRNFSWKKGDRVLQVLIVPVATPELVLVDSLDQTQRGSGGFGSTGA